MPPGPMPLRLTAVCLVRDGRTILAPLTWQVDDGERWIILGANGSGKTTLVQIAGLYLHPSSGTVEVLGETLGRCDVRTVRPRLGFASAALADQLRPQLRAVDAVMTARYAALEPWWHRYTDDDRAAAMKALARMGVEDYAERTIGTLSSGERQRVLLARALLTEPRLLLLDEPMARLDLGGREATVTALSELARDPTAPPTVMVTHHVEEIPPGFDHLLVLRNGEIVATGPLEETLTGEVLTDAFGLPLAVERRPDGRLAAWAR